MALAFRIGNEFLELQPGTILELEEENPFLQVGDRVTGEYSLPFTVPASPTNIRLLEYPNHLSARKNTDGFEAICYVKGIQHSRGRIRIEQTRGNINKPAAGTISLYYLYGLSDFWTTVEGKFLSECEWGEDISYPFTGEFNFYDHGFFGHVTNVINAPVGAFPYAFFPVANSAGLRTHPDKPGTYCLNCITYVPNDFAKTYPASYSVRNDVDGIQFVWTKNEFCAFPYLHIVIEKLFSHFGFKVLGDVLQDTDFRSICLLHNQNIEWIISKQDNSIPITWNMRDMLPKVKISSFLVALCNRFAWWLDWDYRNKVVTIRHKKNILKGRHKRDMTMKSGAVYNNTVNKTGKFYSLVAPGGEDKIPITPDQYKGTVYNRFQLPDPDESREGNYYLALGENAYFICSQNEQGIWVWEKAAGNTFNYKVKNSTDEIPINCLIPDTELMPLGDGIIYHKRMVVPLVDLLDGESDTFYIAYNFGVVTGVNTQGSDENYPYPMASAGRHDLYGNAKVATSLAFEYPDTPDADNGLYLAEWSYYLELLTNREEITIPLSVSITDLLNIEYTDTVVISGVEYWIKNPHFTIPLKEFSSMDLVRL